MASVPARTPTNFCQALLLESHSAKTDANNLFASKDFHNALARYDDALASCPRYLCYPRAVLQSNIAACHISLEQWKEAIKAATDALDELVQLDPAADAKSLPAGSLDEDKKTPLTSPPEDVQSTRKAVEEDDVEEEIISSGATRAAPAPSPPKPAPPPTPASPSPADILRIRTKSLLRRARARSSAGGWQNLAGAEEDYRQLSTDPALSAGLTPADARTVRLQLRDLPPRTKAAQETEMSEMWGKLRNLGDGILKPFGLSTNNFQMVQDEKTGGYSMNFKQGGDSSS